MAHSVIDSCGKMCHVHILGRMTETETETGAETETERLCGGLTLLIDFFKVNIAPSLAERCLSPASTSDRSIPADSSSIAGHSVSARHHYHSSQGADIEDALTSALVRTSIDLVCNSLASQALTPAYYHFI